MTPDLITIERHQFVGMHEQLSRLHDIEERVTERNKGLEATLSLLLPHCRFCGGLGAVVREDAAGRVVEWPCIAGCEPPLVPIRVNNRRRG